VGTALRAAGGRLVAVGDEEYPDELHDLFDPPAALFVVGRLLSELRPRVAVVGARTCSAGGGEMAEALGAAVASAGACLVSGGARGIDAAAHRGAVLEGGGSIAVLGSGVDVAYPAQNRELLASVAASGAVVSEYPPGTRAEPFRFPARNRIVAALCSAVVVVEGAEGSGSMITAEHALEIGRDVLAVPGSVTNPLAAVPLQLIREGAVLIRGPVDLLEDVGLAPPVDPRLASAGEVPPAAEVGGLSEAERAVFDAVAGPTVADAVVGATSLPEPVVAAALVTLEMRNLVRRVGGRFERRLAAGGGGR
jgi:DNA processing protein